MAALLKLLGFLFFFFLLSSSPVSSGKCHKDDKKVLLAIKKAIGDPYVLISWTSELPCCDWPGVGCDDKVVSGRVTSLDITGTNTTFTFPSAIFDVEFIRSITFHKNPGLVGTIPPSIGKFYGLEFLRLDWNSLSGPIPDFGHLLSLRYLNLAFNQLSGTIPPSLGTIALNYLNLDHNRLTGPIPKSLGDCAIVYLYLSNNNLTGTIPQSFGLNIFAQDIVLSRNYLSGDALPLFGNFLDLDIKPLLRLDLSRNHNIEFNMTKVKLPKTMTALDLNHNKVYGNLPPEMGKLEWQLLNVSYNRLCGPIPSGEGIQRFDQYSFLHNKCLCGAPLPPCK